MDIGRIRVADLRAGHRLGHLYFGTGFSENTIRVTALLECYQKNKLEVSDRSANR